MAAAADLYNIAEDSALMLLKMMTVKASDGDG